MHPTRNEIAGFVFGTLDPARADSISTHVDACTDCKETNRELEGNPDDFLQTIQAKVPEIGSENETEYQHFVSLLERIGRKPSVVERRIAVVAIETELGTIRDYRLSEKHGEGGMRAVYKVLHVNLKRIVALKVLPDHRMKNQESVARFRREMEAVGTLDHPNIVRATDAGKEDGTHFLVMEHIEGVDPSKLIKSVGPLRIDDACELIRQAAIGLEHAHRHGLVHRDIKPSNLMLASTSSPAADPP